MPIEPPVISPTSLDEAYAALAESAHRPMAGGTDLLVQLTADLAPPPERVLDLWRLDALRGIGVDGTDLVIGALTTYTEMRDSALVREHLPVLAAAAATVGAAQIQNRGTLGGNVANASPAGDTLPVLLACDAVLVLGSVRGEREVAATDFFVAYRRTALATDELLLRVRFPMPATREVRFRKVGTRRAQAISKVVLALAWQQDAPDAAWHAVRVALGSVAPVPVRAAATEAVLEGARPTLATADLAASTLAGELSPIDDVRSTADYRRAVAARILHRLLRDEDPR
ncbi:MAG TPA: FAD binding domain-containing protein [Candidatus Limnocylindria bacterium]|nr:FAD binding domain-containing protein [Candidatus Limnocylindria bacterium]